ncbi:metallo-beta-lactamase family protein [Alcanivorax balearicus MACL04]|uniref:Metallo-beta-lactamase family protein n=1 Tax=Alloalcanivorax balearicus MACL04 TaxID=1177182 RepID=A0ABT2R0I0_9GAMM|nr:MBL fold metallo-hydrolase [Alloalcanivorax balearicus]MCU5783272.1 metallo-beta-lactamase family protein [Alloalcanivorax balearicus MACL04]
MAALIPGQPTAIATNAWRVLGRNPGMMTGPGTNSYLVGGRALTVIDPGPTDPEHTRALLAAAEELGRPIERIIVTHTHRDHSPGAHDLAAATGAVLEGPWVPDDGLQDTTWEPGRELKDGDTVDCGGLTLEVIATPGHVGNHLCYLLKEEALLFTGDHLIQGSTVVIAPPSGSMSAYLSSLDKLRQWEIKRMAPGHGDVIDEPLALVDHTIKHRLEREKKVFAALTGEATSVPDLVKRVYDDVPEFLHGVACLSLEAHLIKLHEDGRAHRQDDLWHLPS